MKTKNIIMIIMTIMTKIIITIQIIIMIIIIIKGKKKRKMNRIGDQEMEKEVSNKIMAEINNSKWT